MTNFCFHFHQIIRALRPRKPIEVIRVDSLEFHTLLLPTDSVSVQTKIILIGSK